MKKQLLWGNVSDWILTSNNDPPWERLSKNKATIKLPALQDFARMAFQLEIFVASPFAWKILLLFYNVTLSACSDCWAQPSLQSGGSVMLPPLSKRCLLLPGVRSVLVRQKVVGDTEESRPHFWLSSWFSLLRKRRVVGRAGQPRKAWSRSVVCSSSLRAEPTATLCPHTHRLGNASINDGNNVVGRDVFILNLVSVTRNQVFFLSLIRLFVLFCFFLAEFM